MTKAAAQYSIYTLVDPVANDVRYIGSTKGSLEERLKRHLRSIQLDKKHNPNKTNWLSFLQTNSLKPIIELVDVAVSEEEMYSLEEFWTHQFRAWGFPIYNKNYGRMMSYETIQRMKKLMAGNKVSIKAILASVEKNKKSVLQRNLQGEIIGWWRSMANAEKYLKFKAKGKIAKVCNKKGYSAGGYRWEYCSEEMFQIMNKYVTIPELGL